MANQFTNDILKTSVGQICQAIGFQGMYSMPLDVITDLLHRYMSEVCRLTHRYTEHFGRSEPSLDDLGLAFLDMGISVPELEEYINNVDCPSFPHLLPSFPVGRLSNLNFLKPGAREIVSRPIHVHEHLPPMYPEKEEEEVEMKVSPGLDEGMAESLSPAASPQPAVKRSADADSSPSKRAKYSIDEGQPVREIVSVMMTTSGFISSAREGKLPEARCPNIPMVTPRSSSPSTSGAAGRKKLNVEKLIRQKNNQGGSGRPLPNKPPRPIKVKGKDKAGGKGLKMLKMPKMPGSKPKPPSLHKPGSVSGPPGSLTMPPSLKMPMPKVIVPKNSSPKVSTPKIHNPKPHNPKPTPPKSTVSKMQLSKPSTPKIKVPKPPKTPKSETKKTSNPGTKDGEKDGEGSKKGKKDKDQTKKSKESKKEKDTTKKTKEPKKEKESKKEKEPKKEKESKKEKEMKKEEMKKEKERERELILALASSPAVTITSIPTPSKAGPELSGQEKAEGKSKLSIFKKINKSKDAKDHDRLGERDGQPSRDSSPDLMIDETPGRMGQRRVPEDLPGPENPPRRLEMSVEVTGMRSPGGFTSFQDDMSPPGTPSTPRTPEIPHLPIRKTPEKRKGKANKRPRKDRSKSPKGGFSPGHREPPPLDFEPVERPKTPELGLPLEDRGGPSASPFSLPPFPTAPGFIPPFSFPFIPPFGGPPPRPVLPHSPMPDLRLPPHPFLPRPPTTRILEDDHHLVPLDEPENLERPLTPRHARDPSPLPGPGPSHPSPLHSPSPPHLPATPPRPRTPAHHSPPPPPLPRVKQEKVEKMEKEKKKEHKKEKKEKEKDKEKKEKEKEKEKVKKKKDKKDKEKEKEKSDKKEKKDKSKQEKKVKKEKDDGNSGSGPRITMKLTSSSTPGQSNVRSGDPPITPKLVIKPVVKQEEEPPHSKGGQEDQPGSPEIAKFSALITRPPRSQQKRADSPQPLPVLKIKDMQTTTTKKGDTSKTKEVPPLKIKNPVTTKTSATPKASKAPAVPKQQQQQQQQQQLQQQQGSAKLPTSPKATPNKPPSTPKIQEEKKAPGSKKAREKKEKKIKELTQPGPMTSPGMMSGPTGSKVGMQSGPGNIDQPAFPTHQPPHSAMPIQAPPPDTPKSSKKQEQKSTGLLTETVGPIGHFVDDQGNEVWICPTCGKQDDGSPMIGCDTCDDWYHWVCVGIQVPPNDDVNWYCPRCISQHKQRGAPPEKKKRGRKKK